MKIFYLTSTGNNLAIAKALGGEPLSIPRVLKGNNLHFEDDSIGIIFPCWFLGTPDLVQEFLRKATLKADYIFAIMTYGNFAGGGINHFMKVAHHAGVRVDYCRELLMIDNYLPLFDIDDQYAQLPKKNIDANLSQVAADIRNRRQHIARRSAIMSLLSDMAKRYEKFANRKFDTHFAVEDSCDGCGICAKVCPVANIAVNERPEYRHHCISCLSCTHHCPQNAIRVKGEKSRTRFRHEAVSLKEIIAANSGS